MPGADYAKDTRFFDMRRECIANPKRAPIFPQVREDCKYLALLGLMSVRVDSRSRWIGHQHGFAKMAC